ncbi:MAG: glutamyl-tRNA reductase [Mucilaginibacter sp.]|uniref:glutamyl-tRNA reductase n=1 Tax=Mucilaginibacter sp. TaxID=1882438 RepID=UPI003267D285
MVEINTNGLAGFFVAGISYRNMDAEMRGTFAISKQKYERILKDAQAGGISSLFVLSTCNRTEIYCLAENTDQVLTMLCGTDPDPLALFETFGYIKHGVRAVGHLFEVAAGIDSQILGDYEIIGQLKCAIRFSRERNMIDHFLERLSNCALRSSKRIKNETQLSNGSVSVAFSAVRYIREKYDITKHTSILVIGTGKIGRNTCKNLIDQIGITNITLINRSFDKALALANELGLDCREIGELKAEIAKAHIILVASNSPTPVLLKEHFTADSKKLIIDLSVPANVAPEIKMLAGVELVNIDTISALRDATIEQRKAEIPKAMAIISDEIDSFLQWERSQTNARILKSLKMQLQSIYRQHAIMVVPSHDPVLTIQKTVNDLAGKMRHHDQIGCHSINALNEFMVSTCIINRS